MTERSTSKSGAFTAGENPSIRIVKYMGVRGRSGSDDAKKNS
jgi:hypothetical protein